MFLDLLLKMVMVVDDGGGDDSGGNDSGGDDDG